jgi:hypothetical protein
MFTDNKYTRWYYRIIDRSKTRKVEVYVERHHIVPKSLGGTNKKDNLVSLTAREHFVCHLLLTKMTIGDAKKKMSRAFWLMAKGTGKRYRPCSKLYEVARKLFVAAQMGHQNYLKSQTEKSRNQISVSMKRILSEMSPEEKSIRIKNSWSSPESWTIERREKISNALTGKILSKETKQKLSKKCIFISPEGVKYHHHGLKEGCEYHSLNYGSVKNNVSGGKTYKGWKIIYD